MGAAPPLTIDFNTEEFEQQHGDADTEVITLTRAPRRARAPGMYSISDGNFKFKWTPL